MSVPSTSPSPDSSLFQYYMEKCYVLPLELKNDIIYCQRAMRDFLKVHGLVSDVFKDQADADPVQMQRILDELEEEIYEINAEQQHLILRLNEHLDAFYKKLQNNGIESVPDIGNEYISGLIVPLIGEADYKICPQSVLPRDTEEMLIRKHFLVAQDEDDDAPRSPLKLSELDDNVPVVLVKGDDEDSDKRDTKANDVEKSKMLKKFGEVSISQTVKNCSSSVSVMIVPDNVLKANRAPPPLLATKEQRSLLIPRGKGLSEQQAVASSCRPKSAEGPLSKQRPLKMKRSSNSPPPLAPISKPQASPPPSVDLERVAQSRMNLRQALRRARKTKQQPRLIDDEASLEVTNAEGTRKIKLSEQFTPTALTAVFPKGKTSKASTSELPIPVALAKKSSGAQAKQAKTRNVQGARKSDGGGSPPASLVGSACSSSSDDSNHELHEQQRLSVQWLDEPRETRVQPAEYDQEQFLGLFGLYTHDMLKKLNQRHSKRKRRTVQNASGIDFHYGQQLAAMDAARLKKLKAKPEFLLSPKEKRLQAKKAQKVNSGAGRKSKSPDKVEEVAQAKSVIMPDLKCKECKKRTAETLRSCVSCPGFFHLDCHGDAAKVKSPPPNKCPQCLREHIAKVRLNKLTL